MRYGYRVFRIDNRLKVLKVFKVFKVFKVLRVPNLLRDSVCIGDDVCTKWYFRPTQLWPGGISLDG